MKISKHSETLKIICRKAKKGEFLAFDYVKDSGEKSHRRLRVGGDIGKRLAKEGRPINGRGNWISKEAKSSGLRSMFLERGGKLYIRGTDCTTKDAAHKVFIVENMSNLK